MTSAGHASRPQEAPWRSLAALRGSAALVVASGHAVQIFVSPYLPHTHVVATLASQAAVMVFFVISGFSIAAAARRSLATANPLLHYVCHRAARILPPLALALLLHALLASLAPLAFPGGTNRFLAQEGLARGGLDLDAVHALGAMSFLNGFVTRTPPGNGPLWSLSYEVWLYALYILGLLAVVQRRMCWAAAGATLLAVLVWLDKSGAESRFLKYGAVWMLGAAIHHARARRHGDGIPAARILTTMAAITMVLLALQALGCGTETDLIRFNLAAGACFACWLFRLRDRPSDAGRARGLGCLAGFGYTLYLIHYPLMLFVFGTLQEFLAQSPLRAGVAGLATLFVTIACARALAGIAEDRALFLAPLNRHARVAYKP